MFVQEFFQKAAEAHRLSHAYLFSGNDEAQKQIIIADFLLAAAVEAADQFVVKPVENEISITNIRALSTFLSMSAWSSAYKVAVVREAETMNQQAQSALLKILEEPKGNTIFFLLTQYPDMLLYTIRSRAQEFKFYHFASVTIPPEIKKEFETLQNASMHHRFVAAKKLADTPEYIVPKLEQWLVLLRQQLPYSFQSTKTTQEVLHILQTTNANPRLALERLMLDI